MNRYLIKVSLLTLFMAIGLVVTGLIMHAAVSKSNYIGLVYLFLVTVLIHWFIFGQKGTENGLIRRMMVGSMLRMFLGVIFLAISLYNIRPADLFFVVSYCLFFCVFLVFEISEMRTNLRPDSKPRPKNENA